VDAKSSTIIFAKQKNNTTRIVMTQYCLELKHDSIIKNALGSKYIIKTRLRPMQTTLKLNQAFTNCKS